VAEVLVRYMHFIGIIMLSSALISEQLLLSVDNSAKKLKRLAVIDAVFGVSALVVLTAGLLLWFVVGKPAQFYSTNWVFHLKLTLFATIAVLSIYPTIFFVRNRNQNSAEVVIPKSIIMIVRTELLLLLFIPLCAVFMAHGYGLH
jgi:putative membrane protein